MNSRHGAWHPVLALAIRAGVAALVVLNGERVVDVNRLDLLKYLARKRRLVLVDAVQQLASDFAVNTVVAEPTTLRRLRLRSPRLTIKRLTLTIAASTILGTNEPARNGAIYNEIVRQLPKLARHVTIVARTGDVSVLDRRRTVVLLAAALGLACARGQQPPHP